MATTRGNPAARAGQEARSDRALETVERRLDEQFGEGWIASALARAIADGIEELRLDDGTLDPREVEELLRWYSVDLPADDETAWGSADAIHSTLHAAFDDMGCRSEFFDYVEEFIGSLEPIGGIDSTNFGGMTSGWVTHHVLVRGDDFTITDDGDEDGMDRFGMSGRTRVADDPGFDQAYLDIGRRYGGLPPGVWVSGEEAFDTELRDLTYGNPSWRWFFGDAVVARGTETVVEQWAATFAAAAALDDEAARARLRVILASTEPESEAERDLLWEIWKDLRP